MSVADRQLLIVGASVRAAAQSALRAGWQPLCADGFADIDLQACATVIPVPRFPRGLTSALRHVPGIPWIYTGGLENRPRLLDRLSSVRPLLGNSSPAVRPARNPRRIASVLGEWQLPALAVRTPSQPPPADGSWVLKPRRGSAGRGVVVWNRSAASHPTRREPHYFQQRIIGAEFSALFLGTPGGIRLIGISRQLVGIPWLFAPESAWCGNLLGIQPPPPVQQTMADIGTAVGTAFGLRGLFGCDYLVAEGTPWLTEINPRYTGSVELFEYQSGQSWLAAHIQACQESEPRLSPPAAGGSPEGLAASPSIAKAILYAPFDGVCQLELPCPGVDNLWELPPWADLPALGQPIPQGTPLCTLLAAGDTESECLTMLRSRAAELLPTLLSSSG